MFFMLLANCSIVYFFVAIVCTISCHKKPETNHHDHQEVVVYITPTGKKYHSYAYWDGSFSLTSLDNARGTGLESCKVYSPPQ